jgi:hypothetical protein
MTKRVQFDFTDAKIRQVEAVRKRIEAASSAEVVRRAINLLDVATQPNTQVLIRMADGVVRQIEVL